MYYLFHNIYGDADELVATKPLDVVAIPFGWGEEAESIRNAKLEELNLMISSLPALCYWQAPYTLEMVNTATGETQLGETGNCWSFVEIEKLPKPWTWDAIMAETTKISSRVVIEIDAFGNETITYS